MATPGEKVFTWDEVSQHNSVSAGVWVVIDGCVYDVTQFVDEVSSLSLLCSSVPPFSPLHLLPLCSIQAETRSCWTTQVCA